MGDKALGGPEVVPHIGKCAGNDDPHRVFQELSGDCLGDVDRFDGVVGHGAEKGQARDNALAETKRLRTRKAAGDSWRRIAFMAGDLAAK